MAQIKKDEQRIKIFRPTLSRSVLRPKKSLGQHFLMDRGMVDKIISLTRFDTKDVVIEIGPGLGALTIPILPYIFHLVAIEKDPLLLKVLRDNLPLEMEKKITFITNDALKIDLKELKDGFGQKLRIMGNLPYNISSPFLERIVTNRKYIKSAILMFQYEFAQRLTAKANNKNYNALSVITQYYAHIMPLIKVKRDAFYPKPKIDSMLIEMDFEKPRPFKAKNEDIFHKVVKAAFSYRRKTILNSFERGITSIPKEALINALEKCHIDPKRRAETLEVEEFIKLSNTLTATRTNS